MGDTAAAHIHTHNTHTEVKNNSLANPFGARLISDNKTHTMSLQYVDEIYKWFPWRDK